MSEAKEVRKEAQGARNFGELSNTSAMCNPFRYGDESPDQRADSGGRREDEVKVVEKGEQPFSQTVHTHNQPLPLRPRFAACSSHSPFSLFLLPSYPSHSSISL